MGVDASFSLVFTHFPFSRVLLFSVFCFLGLAFPNNKFAGSCKFALGWCVCVWSVCVCVSARGQKSGRFRVQLSSRTAAVTTSQRRDPRYTRTPSRALCSARHSRDRMRAWCWTRGSAPQLRNKSLVFCFLFFDVLTQFGFAGVD